MQSVSRDKRGQVMGQRGGFRGCTIWFTGNFVSLVCGLVSAVEILLCVGGFALGHGHVCVSGNISNAVDGQDKLFAVDRLSGNS